MNFAKNSIFSALDIDSQRRRLRTGFWPLAKNRYILLSLVIVALMSGHILNGQWVGDFWLHSAVIRELATHPFGPLHPILLVDKPYPLYTLWSLGVGLLSNLFDIGPVTILSVLAWVHLVLLLIGLRWFVLLVTKQENAAFYALIFALVLWGEKPWQWSGFLHLNVLGDVLPYPSTFGMALALFALCFAIKFFSCEKKIWLFLLSCAAVIVALTHLVAVAFLYIGLVAFVISRTEAPKFGKRLFLLFFLIMLSLAAAVAWPYYPVFGWTDNAHVWHAGMYEKVLPRIFPALIGVPVLVYRFYSNYRDFLVLFFSGLLLVYFYGALSEHWNYGRLIAPLVLVLQVAAADGAARIERKLRQAHLNRWQIGLVITGLGLLLLVSLQNMESGIRRSIPTGFASKKIQSGQILLAQADITYSFLSHHVDQYDVVLADENSNSFVLTYGGKIVDPPSDKEPFIDDGAARRLAVKQFFSPSTSIEERRKIIAKYRATHLLIDRQDAVQCHLFDQIKWLGALQYTDERFSLIKLNTVHAVIQ
jgi:hypothetical protein